jgi:hypothetical protein
MSLYAVVSPSGSVLNLVTWDGQTTYNVAPNTLVAATGQPNAEIGGTYLNGVFTAPAPAAPMVPVSVTAVQIRLALTQQNLLATVNTAAAADPMVNTYWEYSTTFERAHPLIAQMAKNLNLPDSAVDALFVLAATFA